MAEPVGGPTEGVEQGDPRRDGLGVLDPIEERGRVPSEQHERHQPPARRTEHGHSPTPRQRIPPPGAACEQPHGRRQDRECRRRRVHPPTAQNRQTTERHPPTHPQLAAVDHHEREQDCRREQLRMRLGRQSSDGGDDPGRQDVGEGRDHPHPGPPDAEHPQQPHHRQEACGEQRHPPQPLDHPHREDLGAEAEERPHGEQVPVSLVLQPAPRHLRVPDVQRASQEAPRVEVEVDLGVPDDRVLRDRPRHAPHDEPGQGAPPPAVGSGAGRGRHRGPDVRARPECLRRRTPVRYLRLCSERTRAW